MAASAWGRWWWQQHVSQLEECEACALVCVVADHPGMVTMRSRIGGLRVVDMLSGEQLPRIC